MGKKPAPNGQNKSPSGVWVDIFRTGDHVSGGGREISVTTGDLDQLVASFAEIGEAFRPPLRLGSHSAGIAPAVGWVEGLRREGDHLKALFTNVPANVGKAINQKAYRNVSAGLRHNFSHGDKVFPRILHHVAILGSAVPMIKGLEDLPALFADDGDVITVNFQEENEMNDAELARENERLKAENTRLTEQLKTEGTNFSEAETSHKEALADQETRLKAEHAKELKVSNDKLAEFATKQAEADVDAVMLKAGQEGRVNPGTKDEERKTGLALRQMDTFSEDDSLYVGWKKRVENGKEFVDFAEKAFTNPGGDNEKETKAEADFSEGANDVAEVLGYKK